MKTLIIAIMVIIVVVYSIGLYNRHVLDRSLGPNVALIKGECVMINWDATRDEALWAIHRWLEIKKQ